MRCPKCGYERQTVDDEFVPEGECPRCGVVYRNYLQAKYEKAELRSSTGDFSHQSHGNKGKAGRAVAFIAFGVALCCLAYYSAPFLKKTWDGLRWETLLKEASSLYDQKLYHEAAVPAKRALSGAEGKLGPDSIELSGLLDLLQRIHADIEDYQSAVKYLERLRTIQEKTLGESHQDTRDTMSALISLYYKLGDNDRARPLMSKLISLQGRDVPAQDPLPAPLYTAGTTRYEDEEPVGKEDSSGINGGVQASAGGSDNPKEKDKASPSKSHQVELYITSWCPYCKKAVNFFQSRGITFAAYDIEKDENAARRKKQLDSRNGVPLAVIDGQKIHGYSDESYMRALDHK